MLVEIRAPYPRRVTTEQKAFIVSHSILVCEFRTNKEGEEELGWGSDPIIDISSLGLFHGWEIVRTIDNESTRKLVELGQRNSSVVNNACHVAVAGLGTLTVTEVEHHNDFCTIELQRKLNDGWRIIAVCVQPDQRRPDYILGRSS